MGADDKRKRPPAKTVAQREKQLISLAADLAEKQLAGGTASAQVITHFLKLGTMRSQLEREKLQQENLLLAARTNALESGERIEELYEEAIKAMRAYQGQDDVFEEEEDV